MSWISCVFELFEGCVAIATGVLMSVLGPTAEVLFFAWPKKSTQKKSHPNAALILRAKAFAEGFRKGLPSPSENERHPCRSPTGLFSAKASVLGAAYGEHQSPMNGLTKKLYASGRKAKNLWAQCPRKPTKSYFPEMEKNSISQSP
ncbi:hypothetical protein QLH52_11185 [Methylomonas sp. OY6]|uniref:Uncharacterized protein n=1 Tax=Methylomonas defluvii TaxID=3045149 RepID=A0ABU4UEG3_9GAMM|nr:hypothetical protein [Methylomonas sp. OY6]MDX8127846.1 hypothetical protein [Methylomonas sp. OY6]